VASQALSLQTLIAFSGDELYMYYRCVALLGLFKHKVVKGFRLTNNAL
jgi:hypothetical protein